MRSCARPEFKRGRAEGDLATRPTLDTRWEFSDWAEGYSPLPGVPNFNARQPSKVSRVPVPISALRPRRRIDRTSDGDVRFWHLADIDDLRANVRFRG